MLLVFLAPELTLIRAVLKVRQVFIPRSKRTDWNISSGNISQKYEGIRVLFRRLNWRLYSVFVCGRNNRECVIKIQIWYDLTRLRSKFLCVVHRPRGSRFSGWWGAIYDLSPPTPSPSVQNCCLRGFRGCPYFGSVEINIGLYIN